MLIMSVSSPLLGWSCTGLSIELGNKMDINYDGLKVSHFGQLF
jgi:hypothetical protein